MYIVNQNACMHENGYKFLHFAQFCQELLMHGFVRKGDGEGEAGENGHGAVHCTRVALHVYP